MNNPNIEETIEDDDDKNESSTTLLHVDNQICEMHIENVTLGFHHDDNILNDATTLVMQLPERFSCDKKPSLEQADDSSWFLHMDLGSNCV